MYHLSDDEVLRLHRSTINNVVAERYYMDEFDATLDAKGESLTSAFDMTNLGDINSFWEGFWGRLPDSKEIRTGPFYDICDLAEGDYLIGIDE